MTSPSPRAAALALAVVLVGLAGLGDAVTGDDLAFTLFYLGPVALAAWCSGRVAGLFVATLSSAVWLVVDRHRTVPAGAAVQLGNLATELGVFGTVSLLLSALKERLDLESGRGQTDALTGLKNRRAFHETAMREIDRARRHGYPFTIAFIDLDDFKLVNDRMGHAAGDQVLVAVADVMRRRLRAVDLVARLGGDEFALFLPETDAGEAATALQSLLDQVQALPVGLSVGSVTFLTPPPELDDALRPADALMYEAKRGGKGRLLHKTHP